MKILLWALILIPSISSGDSGNSKEINLALATDRDLGLSTGKGRQDGIISISNARQLAGKYSIAPKTPSVRHQRSQSVSAHHSAFNRQNERFVLDGFEWSLLNVHAFSQLGRPSNLQHPANDLFVLVEFEATNLTNQAAYIHSNLVLTAGGRQYESSSSRVYAEYQMHYDGRSVKVEPGITHKMYYVFDARRNSSYKLIIRSFLGDDKVEKEINI